MANCFELVNTFKCVHRRSMAWKAPGGGLPHERDGDARRKIIIKTLKETNLGVAQALFDP